MYLLNFYVPATHSEDLKNLLFNAGAGKYGNYDFCCWETPGTGQFRPLRGSRPYIGEQEIIQKVKEIKIEIICDDSVLHSVIDILKINHPYEEPAYHYFRINE